MVYVHIQISRYMQYMYTHPILRYSFDCAKMAVVVLANFSTSSVAFDTGPLTMQLNDRSSGTREPEGIERHFTMAVIGLGSREVGG